MKRGLTTEQAQRGEQPTRLLPDEWKAMLRASLAAEAAAYDRWREAFADAMAAGQRKLDREAQQQFFTPSQRQEGEGVRADAFGLSYLEMVQTLAAGLGNPQTTGLFDATPPAP